MRRRGFTPYGPSRAATDSLSRIMAADLAGTGIDVNLLLPGGATRTGMVPDSIPPDTQVTWLDPAIMGPPIVWLASPASDGVTDQRIVATEFADPRWGSGWVRCGSCARPAWSSGRCRRGAGRRSTRAAA